MSKTKSKTAKVLPKFGAARYGNHYFCVEANKNRADKRYFWADQVVITANGALAAMSRWPRKGGNFVVMLAFQPGSWNACYAVSSLDKSPLVVE